MKQKISSVNGEYGESRAAVLNELVRSFEEEKNIAKKHREDIFLKKDERVIPLPRHPAFKTGSP